jgi:uncharacterized protein YndB with AHSA1/START domain
MTTPGPTLRLVRQISAPPAVVFAAWTDAESLKVWMCPGATHVTVAELDVRVGGRFRIVMQDAENETVHTGIYREVQPPERLVFTWHSTMTRDVSTLVTVVFRPQGDATELVLTHERLPDADASSAHHSGWQSILTKLEVYLHQGA